MRRAKAHAHFLGNYVIVVISLTIGPTVHVRSPVYKSPLANLPAPPRAAGSLFLAPYSKLACTVRDTHTDGASSDASELGVISLSGSTVRP